MNTKPLILESVSRSFGAVEVLRDFSLEVNSGEFVAIVGPSGCGKTTLLNLLAGFDKPTTGSLASKGRVRMVYQQDGLFPWRTVAQNIRMGLRHVKGEGERERELKELLALIGLKGFEEHYPHQLSGGMRQRVELARALAGDTDTLLLDEPFSALDYLTRLRLRRELARLLRERPRTVVLVTHDIEEAAQLADRVVVLSERPARIRCELNLELERPRDPTHPLVVEAMHRILTVLGLEQDTVESEALRA
ncbi:MAG: NitT/TauT family transport system ATP-binding protein [Acidobacteriota bacterium]|jgi:ABC-type nitrate/sulfonate/bicarbonate transport system ATPase subunit|nr:NitT/TauT family transport system ATP-binding protein [Acidobacteriota bacterium]